jgi:hypothetical protein
MELSGFTFETELILFPSYVRARHCSAATSTGANTVNTKTKVTEEGASSGAILKYIILIKRNKR